MIPAPSARFKRLFAVSAILSAVVLVLVGGALWPQTAVADGQSAPQTAAELTARQSLPTVQFAATTYTIDENDTDGEATINIQISQVPTLTNRTVTVTYSTADGTASAGSDYGATSGEIVYEPGDNAIQSFTVNIVNDNNPEEDETVTLILQGAQNAVLGSRSVSQLIIRNDDASPTPTSQSQATPIYADIYEPNNTLETAYTLQPDINTFCNSDNATFWPTGDVDFYRFWGTAGSAYEIRTDNVDAGLDTVLRLYNPDGVQIDENDDIAYDNRNSEIIYSVLTSGYYYLQVNDKNPTDPADRTYCLQVDSIEGTATPTPPPTNTPFPTSTRVPGADSCEPNFDFDIACLTAPGETLSMNFVPADGEGLDNDYYRLWIKQGFLYTCETTVTSDYNDTNLILYDANRNGIGGNDDKEPGVLGSKVTFYANYTGWLYALVGPTIPIEYAVSYLYTYDFSCTAEFSTLTPTPTPTATPYIPPPSTGGGGGSTPRPTDTPAATASPQPTTDVLATVTAAGLGAQPTATPTTVVGIVPLPTSTPMVPPSVSADLTVVLFYDENDNNLPEITEGIQDMPVSVYDAATGQLLSLGRTNEAGQLRFMVSPTGDLLRVSVPFFNINQTVSATTTEILVRVSPNLRP